MYIESIGMYACVCIYTYFEKNYTLFRETALEVRFIIAAWFNHQIAEMFSSGTNWHTVEILIEWSEYVKNSNIFNSLTYLFEFGRKDSFK